MKNDVETKKDDVQKTFKVVYLDLWKSNKSLNNLVFVPAV